MFATVFALFTFEASHRLENDYATMLEMVRRQPLLPGVEDLDAPDDGPEDESIDCFCTS